jgi:hypothetical protein
MKASIFCEPLKVYRKEAFDGKQPKLKPYCLGLQVPYCLDTEKSQENSIRATQEIFG